MQLNLKQKKENGEKQHKLRQLQWRMAHAIQRDS